MQIAYGVVDETGGARPPGAVRRVKQLLRHWTAGNLIQGAEDRQGWLRETDAGRFLARLQGLAKEPSPRPGFRGTQAPTSAS